MKNFLLITTARRFRAGLVVGALLAALGAWPMPRAQEAPSTDAPGVAAERDGADLKTRQEQLASRYKRFEEVMLRMAELTAGDDPQRAALLRQAVARSKKQMLGVQFDRLVELLDQDRLSLALTGQNELVQDLRNLLELLLSEDRAERLASEKERIRGYLKELNRLIAEQQGIHSQTRRASDQPQIADRQGKVADRTGNLAEKIAKDENEARRAAEATEENRDQSDAPRQKPAEPAESDRQGQQDPHDSGDAPSDPAPPNSTEQPPGEGGQPQNQQQSEVDDQQPPPGGPTEAAQERLQAAQKRMREAREKLKQAQRDQALDRQRQALEELEQAKADLEKILRQLREEELARVLAFLEARFRKMLEDQTQVLEATARLVAQDEAQRGRGVEIEAGRLSRKETQIAVEADKTLTLLREDGTVAAMPEAVRQLRDDMQEVSRRLGEYQVDALTQGLEEDIVAGLEDIIAALEKAQKDLQQQQNQQQPPPPGESQEPPLVDRLAELKVIRALQLRVNRRTETYSKLVDGEQATRPEILTALEELADRQERIYRATRDVATGRNQ
jgi:hypothetical protein